MHKRVLLILTICYTLVIAVLSLVNIKSLPKLGSSFDDKIFHALAYGILVLLWYFTLNRLKITKPIFISALFSIIYGIILEVLQGLLTIARSLDILDVLANCIGVTIASVFIVYMKQKNR
ncbi:VanZ family protein [Olleya sp. AH-315-F22]|nr:VanZ family protein [Olleya sp. AH-315-F22]